MIFRRSGRDARSHGRPRRAPAAMLALSLSVTGLVATSLVIDSAGAQAATTAGCGKSPSISSGTRSINSGGKTRSYIISVPDGYDSSKAYKLIFGMHWRDGSATDVATGQTVQRDSWAYYGLKRLANNTAIFIAPQGLNAGWANSNGEDVTLIDNIISEVENALCVDTGQVYSTGWSYGGAFSYALACARPNVFRAVAVLSGAQLSGCAGGTQPVPYMGVHGVHDSVLNISMGRSIKDTFVKNNGCTAASPPEAQQGSGWHTKYEYSGCKAGYPVRWYTFDGDHIPAPADGVGGMSGNTWVPAETWDFFSQFFTSTSTTSTTTTTTPPQNGVVLQSTFESGTDSWTGRGSAQVATASGTAHGGSAALSVTGRTDAWNGATVSATSVLVPGRSYDISAWVRLPSGGSSTSLNLSVERNSGGTTSYDHVGDAVTVTSGAWALLSGTYTVPSDAQSLSLYVEGTDTASFLLDDVVVATAGSVTTTTTKTTTTTTKTTSTATTTTTTTKSTTTTTKSTKTTKVKTVKKCKTGKNGKKTCKTITKKVKNAACGVRITAAWPGGFVAVIPEGSRVQVRQVTGATSVLGAAGGSVVVGTGSPAALPSGCSGA